MIKPAKIFSEYNKFRKNLNEALRAKDMLEINYEYDLNIEFYRGDIGNLLIYLDKMKKSLLDVKGALK